MTDLSSAFFDTGWQARNGIDYDGLQWVATGERLTAETFARYREQGGYVVIHSIPEEVARLAVAEPTVMIASDGAIENGQAIRAARARSRACSGTTFASRRSSR